MSSMPATPNAGNPRGTGRDAGPGPAARAEPRRGPGNLDALAALGEPTRRALYTYVVAQDRPVSRDEAAGATGTKRSTATFHLERLVGDGLLDTRFARLSGRTGPGAGRTAKLYARAHREIAVSLPPRRYEIAGEILARAVEEAQRGATGVSDAVAQAAERAGRQTAAEHADLAGVLASVGYEPRCGPGSDLHLANCPFHDLAARHADLVCAMNLHLLRGVIGQLGVPAQAQLDPAEGRCCVTITLG
jgi:predicted ArsR family transcriptional regulator